MARINEKNQVSLTYKRLVELLEYCKTTGNFYWLVSTSRRVKVGDIAGSRVREYIKIQLEGKSFTAHRLVWFYHHKVWPNNIIDHINGNPIDNRIENLRDVSMKINAENCVKYKRSEPTLPTGVAVGRYSKDGVPDSYMAYWQGETCRTYSKWFNVKKHGSIASTIAAASAYREQMIITLNNQGANYTDRHGKSNKGNKE